MASPHSLLQRIEQGNRSASTFGVDNALVIAELGHRRLGDTLQSITGLRFIKERFGIRHLDVNLVDRAEFQVAATLLQGDPSVRRYSNLPYAEIRFPDYQWILHYTTCTDSPISAQLSEHYDEYVRQSPAGIAFHSLIASGSDLEARYGEQWREFIYPLPLLEPPVDMLECIGGNHRFYLAAEERAWAQQWLAKAGVTADDALIVFVDDASTAEKLLPPDENLRLLEHLLSLDNAKVLIYDVHGTGKRDEYCARLPARVADRLIVANSSDLRKNVALLGAEQVSLILGPDTGLMHCASAVYAARMESECNGKCNQPAILVYLGRWGAFDSRGIWKNSLATCMVFSETEGRRALRRFEELPAEPDELLTTLAPLRDLAAAQVIDFLQGEGAQAGVAPCGQKSGEGTHE